jgi:hypothetical protein
MNSKKYLTGCAFYWFYYVLCSALAAAEVAEAGALQILLTRVVRKNPL